MANPCFTSVSKVYMYSFSSRSLCPVYSCVVIQLLGNQDEIKDMLEKMKNSYGEQQKKLEEKVWGPKDVCRLQLHQALLRWNIIIFPFPVIKQPNPSQDGCPSVHPTCICSVVHSLILCSGSIYCVFVWCGLFVMWLSVDFGHYSFVVELVFGHQGGYG